MSDASDLPINQSVFVAWLPIETEWCKQDLPHSTIVYAGSMYDLPPSDKNAMMKAAMAIAATLTTFLVKVRGTATFGSEGERVTVLTLEDHHRLFKIRDVFESWNKSEHPYNPHATVGPVGSEIDEFPMYLTFDRILVGWGEEQHIYQLQSSEVAEAIDNY